MTVRVTDNRKLSPADQGTDWYPRLPFRWPLVCPMYPVYPDLRLAEAADREAWLRGICERLGLVVTAP